MDNIKQMSDEKIDNEIAKLIGWTKVRKNKGTNTYSGINPLTEERADIPCFAMCPEAIHIAENYVAQEVGMAYIIYLGKVNETPEHPASWATIQQAFTEPKTRAIACLSILKDIKNGKIHTQKHAINAELRG
ncbi:MAG: hypothetical protein EKK63_10895 [Acinetobacter sp.]|uniref:hypothetical protein n=1 Tax=Acinetobacter sp. TaxID=472 RepID=UPI000FA9FC6D|nr:hypothetical protein [Acinetobacter sp.]RUP38873.1 MAG: hypothetical protein EKK63_10895 [Acinetobacter sp.]